jgi:hypothetical protein
VISVTLGRHRADGITIRVGNLRMPGAAGWPCRKLDQSAAMLRSVAEDWLPSRKLDAKLHELDMRNIEREERRNKAKRGPISKQGERGAGGERGPIGPPGSSRQAAGSASADRRLATQSRTL